MLEMEDFFVYLEINNNNKIRTKKRFTLIKSIINIIR
jgi:hypothetical protein